MQNFLRNLVVVVLPVVLRLIASQIEDIFDCAVDQKGVSKE